MKTSSTERIDLLALVWLVVPRQQSRVGGFADQLKHVATGAKDRKRLAEESIARLQKRGLVGPGARLELTTEGHKKALEALGVSTLPKKPSLQWAKKALLLRSLGAEATSGASKKAREPGALAALILARRHRVERKHEASLTKVGAILARRALGLEEKPTIKLDDVFSAVFLVNAVLAPDGTNAGHESAAPASATRALRLADCKLPEFANQVNEAARSSPTGRWHGAVFISHVWNTLRHRGDVGITFENFQKRLVEAYQADLLELSRADLVEAMPAADVSASETTHLGARFHFVRLEQLAS
ncbi:MAG TPA: hypothetical protein VFQ35_08590 [Polyangiaceae bacterium]|nr:hypothetical protein [Polyangiaceae bacterium]